MKKILLVLLTLVFHSQVNALNVTESVQNFPNYIGIVQCEGTTDYLLSKIKSWSFSSLKDTKLMLKQETNQSINFEGVTKVSNGSMGVAPIYFSYILSIECKENRFKYTVKVIDVQIEDGPFNRVFSVYDKYNLSPDTPRVKKNLEKFHNILLKWLEDISVFNPEMINEDW